MKTKQNSYFNRKVGGAVGYTFIFLLGWILGLVTGLVEKVNKKIKGNEDEKE
ncbi:hypothetical protein [Bacillus sp. TH25]|uniref:hypothetical protein n=1 Tax=Bacillus sp. TH25 TaxID=2796391 RepID=UPI0019114235|nr:hypothetical protein [Bacillus sp. TH25]MBK5433378.1 hypothetical protein [Bacillus sp. TH25]